jgi:predicted membrane chloride channel (bestrophin family)
MFVTYRGSLFSILRWQWKDRWWEGRKLWGRLVNLSRHFATQVQSYLAGEPVSVRHELVRRHIAYVHVLRCLLRGQNPLEDDEVIALINEVGRVLETPFTMFWPTLPLSALSRTIEIDLRQRIGDTDLPLALQPDARGILM